MAVASMSFGKFRPINMLMLYMCVLPMYIPPH